ncbi:unnamed protein product [Anisakis simplex]|uniref:C-type lectin domain-containing protein n=1 Tax=Anisakis simplex TaxID=6269 RepID=A0A3P6PSS1_ANISI|nr:unnamed protein product [Anisakis simplex]
MATIDSRDLLVALKQSSVFNPRTSYRVLSNIDGTNVFMSSSQFSRNYNYLCESRGKERCPEGFEMWNGKCYRFFSEKQGFEEAAETCAQISAYSTLASAEDETTNRFLSSTLLSFSLPSR